jgi:hypothetical protein
VIIKLGGSVSDVQPRIMLSTCSSGKLYGCCTGFIFRVHDVKTSCVSLAFYMLENTAKKSRMGGQGRGKRQRAKMTRWDWKGSREINGDLNGGKAPGMSGLPNRFEKSRTIFLDTTENIVYVIREKSLRV